MIFLQNIRQIKQDKFLDFVEILISLEILEILLEILIWNFYSGNSYLLSNNKKPIEKKSNNSIIYLLCIRYMFVAYQIIFSCM